MTTIWSSSSIRVSSILLIAENVLNPLKATKRWSWRSYCWTWVRKSDNISVVLRHVWQILVGKPSSLEICKWNCRRLVTFLRQSCNFTYPNVKQFVDSVNQRTLSRFDTIVNADAGIIVFSVTQTANLWQRLFAQFDFTNFAHFGLSFDSFEKRKLKISLNITKTLFTFDNRFLILELMFKTRFWCRQFFWLQLSLWKLLKYHEFRLTTATFLALFYFIFVWF